MHVSHVNLGKELRGGERQMLTLIEALRNKVDQAVVVRRNSRLHAAVTALSDIDIAAVPSSPVAASLRLRKTDVAHIHEGRSIRAGALASFLFDVPYVITRRMLRKPHTHFLTRQCYRRAGRITTVSRTVHACMHEYDEHLPLQTIYDYVPSMAPDAKRVHTLRSAEGSKLIVAHIGELNDAHKGQGLLLRVARRIANSHPDVVFWLIGSGKDEQSLREAAGDLNNVRFCGWADSVADYYAAMDIFVYPSRFEALGSANIEAMSFGLPILASCVDGIPEIVRHEQNGLLFRAGDIADFTAQLCRLLENRPLRCSLGRAAKETASRFSAAEAANRFYEIYSQLHRQAANHGHHHARLRY